MSAVRWFTVSGAFIAAACIQDLEDAPCPCVAGYECCKALDVCLPKGASCESGPGGGQPSTGGSAASSGDSAASSGDSAGGRISAGSAGGAPMGHGGSPARGGSFASGGDGGSSAEGATSGSLGGAGSAGETGAPPLGGSPDMPQAHFAWVATQHNDDARTGANLEETELDTSNVSVARFGELSRRPLRGAVVAQPLVAPNVKLADESTRDVVFVATVANAVYALDARQPELAPIWSRQLGDPILLPDALIDAAGSQLFHEIGILGTPVLSAAEHALYLVAATKSGETYAHTAYKLSLSTGETLASRPIEHSGFQSSQQAQRAALSLADGSLYVVFGGYSRSTGDGWLFAFDADLELQAARRLAEPSGANATMNGQGPAVDANGALYLTTNSGAATPDPLTPALASRLLEVRRQGGELQVAERLFPAASASMSNELGSAGPVLIPGSDRLLLAGQHVAYSLPRNGAGGSTVQEFRASDTQLCRLASQACDAMPSAPVFWPGSGTTATPRAYFWSPYDMLRAFRFDAGTQRFDCADAGEACQGLASAASNSALDFWDHPAPRGAHLSVSSDGARAGSGIVWAAHEFTDEVSRNPDGMLRAFDAETLRQLWSTQDARTPLGALPPGASPTVSGGRVFMGTGNDISTKWVFWDEVCAEAPALGNLGDRFLVAAWGLTRPEVQGFQLAWSSDGATFEPGGRVSDSILSHEPALAGDGGSRLFMAWTASTHELKVQVDTRPDFADAEPVLLASGERSQTLPYAASTAPALAWGDDELFLAWHDGDTLHVLSAAHGTLFDPASLVTIPGHFSYRAPALAFLDGTLYLLTTDDSNQTHLFVSRDGGADFEPPLLLSLRSAGHPALLSSNPQAAAKPDLHLLWAEAEVGGVSPTSLRGAWVPAADHTLLGIAPQRLFASESAYHSIAAAQFRGTWSVAWCGTGTTSHPNVARYSPGEVVTYGVLPP